MTLINHLLNFSLIIQLHRWFQNLQRESKKLQEAHLSKQRARIEKNGANNWWKITSELLESDYNQTSIIATLKQENESNVQFASRFNVHFSSISSLYTPTVQPNIHDCKCDECYCSLHISPCDVYKKLKTSDVTKAIGPDELPNLLFAGIATLLSRPLSNIFSASINQSLFPSIWKDANLCLLPKMSNSLSLSDLRPISLTYTLGKIIENLSTLTS